MTLYFSACRNLLGRSYIQFLNYYSHSFGLLRLPSCIFAQKRLEFPLLNLSRKYYRRSADILTSRLSESESKEDEYRVDKSVDYFLNKPIFLLNGVDRVNRIAYEKGFISLDELYERIGITPGTRFMIPTKNLKFEDLKVIETEILQSKTPDDIKIFDFHLMKHDTPLIICEKWIRNIWEQKRETTVFAYIEFIHCWAEKSVEGQNDALAVECFEKIKDETSDLPLSFKYLLMASLRKTSLPYSVINDIYNSDSLALDMKLSLSVLRSDHVEIALLMKNREMLKEILSWDSQKYSTTPHKIFEILLSESLKDDPIITTQEAFEFNCRVGVKYTQQMQLSLKDFFNSKMKTKYKAVMTSVVENRSICKNCSFKLQPYEMDMEKYEQLKTVAFDAIVRHGNIYFNADPDEAERYINFAKRRRDYAFIIDGLNVVYSKRVQRDGIHDLIMLIRHLRKLSSARGILVTLNHSLKPMKHVLLNAVDDMVDVFFTNPSSKDDAFILYATILHGPDCHVVSNDFFRKEMYNFHCQTRAMQSCFERHVASHRIGYSIELKGRIHLRKSVDSVQMDHAGGLHIFRSNAGMEEKDILLCVQKPSIFE